MKERAAFFVLISFIMVLFPMTLRSEENFTFRMMERAVHENGKEIISPIKTDRTIGVTLNDDCDKVVVTLDGERIYSSDRYWFFNYAGTLFSKGKNEDGFSVNEKDGIISVFNNGTAILYYKPYNYSEFQHNYQLLLSLIKSHDKLK